MPDAATEPPDTPYLVVDAAILDANIARMAQFAADRGLALRPHGKTHKSPDLARRQLAAGAVGLTVATVAEAEVFASAGITDLFIAYPVWLTDRRAARLRALTERARLRVGVDSVPAAQRLGAALAGRPAQVVVEIDSGHHRSGVAPEAAATVARAAAGAGLDVAGIFTFPGHGYDPSTRAAAAADEAAALGAAAAELAAVGLAPRVISGGSTPTVAFADAAALTELRPGVYPFNDAQQAELGSCDLIDVALTAVSTVVSARGRRVITDAGSKVLGADRLPFATGWGRLPDQPRARVIALSEHHATVDFPSGVPAPGLGERIRIAPNHVCAAVNLADELMITRGGAIVECWPVAARGANT